MSLKLKYFVLKPAGESQHARASRAAMQTYAAIIKSEDEALAKELMQWVQQEGAAEYLAHTCIWILYASKAQYKTGCGRKISRETIERPVSLSQCPYCGHRVVIMREVLN